MTRLDRLISRLPEWLAAWLLIALVLAASPVLYAADRLDRWRERPHHRQWRQK